MNKVPRFFSRPLAPNHRTPSVFLFCTLLIQSGVCLATANASAAILPNWNQFERKTAGEAPQAFAYLVSKNIVRSALNRQVVPVLVFSCTSRRMNAAISFNELGIKGIKNITFELDGRRVAFTPWGISSSNNSIDYGGNVPVMIRALFDHHSLRMRLVGLTGSSINATFDVEHAESGTSGVRQTCALAGN